MVGSTLIDSLEQKLPEPELRQLAKDDTDQKVSVIIELDLPSRRILFTKSEVNRDIPAYTPKRVVEESPGQHKENARKIEKARDFLESLVGKTPRWLSSARAFVVTVTPEQLREIAQSSLTKTIRLNRNLQKNQSKTIR